jgi:hypothetical protein
MLARHPGNNVRVLVVWEPILPTDWSAPSGSALGRISDARVRQFWDPQHVVSRALSKVAQQTPPRPEPDCCIQKGFYWDDAILYAPRLHWESVPASRFWNGPVIRVIPGLERSLGE